MPRRGKAKKNVVKFEDAYSRMRGNVYTPLPLPSDVPVPMCFCGDPCKVDISDEFETYKQRYWMCVNWTFPPIEQMRRIGMMTPPALCDFEQWIDTEISEEDKRLLAGMKAWDEERRAEYEKRCKEEVARKERHEEEKIRRIAEFREEKEKKLERVRRAKEALEDNPDALRKGKWPRCTQ